MLIEIRSYLIMYWLGRFYTVFLTLTKLRLFFHWRNSLRKIIFYGILSICNAIWVFRVMFRADFQWFCGKR